MQKVQITQENKHLIDALSKLQIGDTITFQDGKVLIEPKPEFKKGDFITTNDPSGNITVLFERFNREQTHLFHSYWNTGGYSNINWKLECFKLSTEQEKAEAIEQLHSEGKDWDPEICEIVDWVWKPKTGEKFFYINNFGEVKEWTRKFDSDRLNINEFRTKELAEAALELLKNAKHF